MKKDVKKFLANSCLFMFIIAIIILIFIIIITWFPTSKFRNSYQYALNLKYNNLKETKSPKIIILAGSSSGFGINTEIIEEKTNMPVVNMGLHASFGTRFNTEISKVNIEKGDIVVLAHEYERILDINTFSPELIMARNR